MTVLILCTGNSCRSQMAESFLKAFNPKLAVYSAGTIPSNYVHPVAIKVMNELKIDLKSNYPKSVNHYLNENFDFVITVCGGAKENCPTFSGKVRQNIHIGFNDPADATGTEEDILNEFRKIRDQILVSFYKFHRLHLNK